MMSTNNILSPANGKPIIVPSQDIVLGLYYLTLERDGEPGEGMVFGSIGELEQALDGGMVTLHAKVQARLETVDDAGNPVKRRLETTPGRALLTQLLPRNPNISIQLLNQLLTKREITNVIDVVYRHCGQKETVIFADRVMAMGFAHACKAGISFGKDDLVIPSAKESMVASAQDSVKQFEQQYLEGLITQGEKYNKVLDAWSRCTDEVAEKMMEGIANAAPGPARQLGLHDGPFRRSRLGRPDEAARRHARADGQAVRRDHRDADHLQFQGGADGAGILQLLARCPQGPGRHGAQDRQLRLSDAPSGRRRPGLHRPGGGLRHQPRPDGARGRRRRRGAGDPGRAASRTLRGRSM